MEVNIAKDTFIGAIHSEIAEMMCYLVNIKSFRFAKKCNYWNHFSKKNGILKYFRNDLTIKLCRGNIESRISKLNENKYDALVLAEAGLNRLDINYSYKIPIKICHLSWSGCHCNTMFK